MKSSSSNSKEPSAARTSLLARAWRLGPGDWADFAVAVAELALARARLATRPPESLLGLSFGREAASTGFDGSRRAERVRIAIARAQHRVPWRSDCLVQALAAKHWLDRLGVSTKLVVGVNPGAGQGFEAHAWLTHGEKIVTGGNVGGYQPLVPSADH